VGDEKKNGTALAKQGKARETYGDLDKLAGAMQAAGQRCNLIAPIVALDHIPLFFEVSLRVVSIDPREMRDGGECYSVPGGKLALGKSALAKLALAAGIQWDAMRSGRLDDGSDPYYVHYRAVGAWPDFDGRTVLQISGSKVLDLREGSATLEKLAAESKDGGEKRVREMRAFILEHAESKARNRAIRQALALRSSYTREDLQKPFVVPRLVETGRCDDPELRRLYYEKKLEGKGLAQRMLYGTDPALKPGDMEVIEVTARAIATEPLGKQPPPPVNTIEDYDQDTGEVTDDGLDPFGGDR